MIAQHISKITSRSLTLRKMVRWYYAHTAHHDWSTLLKHDKEMWKNALYNSKTHTNVLVATSMGFHFASATLESLLAIALTLRGAHIHVLICDSVLPACMICELGWYPDYLQESIKKVQSNFTCRNCFNPAFKNLKATGLKILRYSEFLGKDDIDQARKTSFQVPFNDISRFSIERCSAGEHAVAGALRFLARGNFHGERFAESIVRQYLEASIITYHMMKNLLGRYHYDVAVFNHGIYIPQGIIGEVCRRENIRVVNWNPAYRKSSFIFSHDNSYHHTMISEPVEKWKNIHWSESKDRELMAYLKSRWRGIHDWIWFHEKPDEEIDKIFADMRIDQSKDIIGMLTNVMWDAQLHYKANAFPDMLTWVLETIRYFAQRNDLQLLIRIHPAEIRGTLPSRQPLLSEIKKVFPELPSNVFIIPPESQTSTYAAMMKCDSVIIYGTKTGVELTAMGIPVIVAGEAWVRNKGFTFDANSTKEYFEILQKLPFRQKMNREDQITAQKYAYHFFFRRMIPVEFIKPNKGWPYYGIQLSNLNDLRNSSSRGLDTICNGILHEDDFIYPTDKN